MSASFKHFHSIFTRRPEVKGFISGFVIQVLFDHKGCIRHFHRVEEILREFFDVRLDYYHRRKHYLEGMLSAETLKLDNIARFILEKIEGTIVIGELLTLDIERSNAANYIWKSRLILEPLQSSIKAEKLAAQENSSGLMLSMKVK